MRLPPLKNGNHLPPEEGSDPNVPVTKGDMRRGLFWSDIKSFIIAAGAVVTGVWGALHALDARGQAQVDAGVAVVRAATDERIHAIEQRLDRQQSVSDATQSTVFAIAIKLGVQPTVPAPRPRDGGP